ncbi:MAG: DUF4422 domain-containing protein [Clostridia bacterium]|nr:DUF4422 domain-containing protein [Clostridia bacterium]
MKCVMAVALHKAAVVPEDELYLPVQVGGAELGYTGDDTGDHISGRNATFCELTAHYWLWKNVQADAYGLCHYRRYFTRSPMGKGVSAALSLAEAEKLLEAADVIVPKPRIYLIETNYTQYAHAHHAADLEAVRAILAERHPDDLAAYDRVMKRCWGRRFNMCLMKKAPFEAYSAWLFDILFELERRLDISAYSERDRRVFGYVAERLMDVWLERNQPRMHALRVMNLESQHWFRKIATFLRRRLIPEEKWHLQG